MKYRACAWLALGLILVLTACTRQVTPPAPVVLTIDRAEAVQADWLSGAAPATGWTPVKLMDYWNSRWPQHDGVVWYRVHWNQANADAPLGIMLEYVCMADACLLYTSPSPRDGLLSRMPSSA